VSAGHSGAVAVITQVAVVPIKVYPGMHQVHAVTFVHVIQGLTQLKHDSVARS
jgi:hypothetical protein